MAVLFYSVRLIWVANLANKAACEEFIGPEPRIGITIMTVQTEVRPWADNAHRKLW